MANKHSPAPAPAEPAIYQLRLQGQLSAHWSDWLEGMTISLAENGDTLVTGPVIDQAALHGLLRKVRDLGIPLLAVNRIQPGQTDGPVCRRGGAASARDP